MSRPAGSRAAAYELASNPAFVFIQGQLSVVLASCQQLPEDWEQGAEFTNLLQRALAVLQSAGGSMDSCSSTISSDADVCIGSDDQRATDGASDSSSSHADDCADSVDQEVQHRHKQQQQQQKHIAEHQPAVAAAEDGQSIAARVALLDSSNSADTQLHVLFSLLQQVDEERAGPEEAAAPVRSAICKAGGINHLLQLLTNSSSSNNVADSTSSVELAIEAGRLLLALTECGSSTRRSYSSWAHRHIQPDAIPALSHLLLHSDPLAKRAAELLTSLARDASRHGEIAAAGGISALLHVLSDDNAKEQPPGKAAVLRRPYAVLAAATAALESLIDGPSDVQVAIAQAGGVEVLEGVCEYLVRQQLARKRKGPGKQLDGCCGAAVAGGGAVVRHSSASSMQ